MAFNVKQILFWLAFVASVVLLFAPISTGGRDQLDLDKAIHVFVFAVLILTALYAYPNKKLLIGTALVAYAFVSEFIQGRYLPLRHFDWYDLVADLVGLLIGVMISIIVFKSKNDEKKESLAND